MIRAENLFQAPARFQEGGRALSNLGGVALTLEQGLVIGACAIGLGIIIGAGFWLRSKAIKRGGSTQQQHDLWPKL